MGVGEPDGGPKVRPNGRNRGRPSAFGRAPLRAATNWQQVQAVVAGRRLAGDRSLDARPPPQMLARLCALQFPTGVPLFGR